MSETIENSEVEGAVEEKHLTGQELIQDETGAEGRYIPYSGGSMGWFENAGVLKCERGNDYRFHTAVDAQKIRQKLFERWGNTVSRRIDTRFKVQKEVPVRITVGTTEFDVETKDLSSHGLRLQLLEDPALESGDKLVVRVFRRPDYTDEVMALDSEVMWVARVGKRRLVWNLGISFTKITEARSLELKNFLLE